MAALGDDMEARGGSAGLLPWRREEAVLVEATAARAAASARRPMLLLCRQERRKLGRGRKAAEGEDEYWGK